MDKQNRLNRFLESLPANPDSNEQFAMVIASDSSDYGGDNTYACSNQVLSACKGTNGGCTNYNDACAESTNNNVDTRACSNVRIPIGTIDPNT